MLEISRLLWINLVLTLRARGQKRRESGAFLLAKGELTNISSFICYDDLDPNCLDRGYINLSGAGFIPLWKHCADKKCRVVADVHTHPDIWVKQSQTDLDHPMLSMRGHMAFIIPNFAYCPLFSLNGIGAYRYLGDSQWQTFNRPQEALRLTLF